MHKRFRSVLKMGLVLSLGCTSFGCAGGSKATNKPGEGGLSVEEQTAQRKKAARAQSLVSLANEDLGVGRYVSARRRAEEALEANPNNADAYAILGAARWREGDFAGSNQAFRKAVEIDGENFGALVGLGRNLQAEGKHEEAIALQDRLLKKDKDQVDPLLTKLRSLYALVRADEASPVVDQVQKLLAGDDPKLLIVQAYAGFIKAIAGKGPFLEIAGDTGKSDLQLDLDSGLKHSLSVIGGSPSRVLLLEIREESVVDPGLVKKLKLESVGKVKPVGQEEEQDVVIVPELKFGDMTVKNVPALVQPLADFAPVVGETPGMILGRQFMQRFGAVTLDYPARTLGLSKAAPATPAEGEGTTAELPFLLVDMFVLQAPAVPLRIDGSDHDFFVYLGGIYKSGASISRKAYLKSGHLPREIDPPDDPEQGLTMVYLDKVVLGDVEVEGVGGLVFVNEIPDPNLGQILETTAFELGGYLNVTLLQNWKVTYAVPTGKLYVTRS